jgi:membrane protease YdiL (CAAX protease family)
VSGSQPYPGVAYLRTLRRPQGGWWRLLTAVVLGAIALFATAVIAILVVIVAARAVGSDYSFDFDKVDAGLLLATNLGLAALIPCSTGIVWMLYGVRPRWVSSHRPGLRWRWLWFCVVMSATVWSVLFVLATIGAAVDRSSPIDSKVFGFLAVVLLTTPLQAAGEEYLFRGLLLQSLGATRMPPWLCMVVSAALFATAHGQFDPPLFADRLVLGVVLAWVATRTGGLEAGIAIHAVKNLSVLIPASLLDEVDSALEPTGVTWIPLIVDVVLLAILVPWMLAMCARRRRDGRLVPGEPQPWLAEAESMPLPLHYGYPPPAGWVPPGGYGWAPYPQYPYHPPSYPPYWQPPPGYPPPGYAQPGWPPAGYPPPGWQQPTPYQGEHGHGPPPYQGPPYGSGAGAQSAPRPPDPAPSEPPDAEPGSSQP